MVATAGRFFGFGGASAAKLPAGDSRSTARATTNVNWAGCFIEGPRDAQREARECSPSPARPEPHGFTKSPDLFLKFRHAEELSRQLALPVTLHVAVHEQKVHERVLDMARADAGAGGGGGVAAGHLEFVQADRLARLERRVRVEAAEIVEIGEGGTGVVHE